MIEDWKNSLFLKATAFFAALTVGSSSWAQDATAAAAPNNPVQGLLLNLPIVLALFGLFYFGLIRPQKNQQRKHSEFLSALSRGEEVVTAGGLIGTIRGLTDRVVTLEISSGTEVKVLRTQIQNHLKDVLPQG